MGAGRAYSVWCGRCHTLSSLSCSQAWWCSWRAVSRFLLGTRQWQGAGTFFLFLSLFQLSAHQGHILLFVGALEFLQRGILQGLEKEEQECWRLSQERFWVEIQRWSFQKGCASFLRVLSASPCRTAASTIVPRYLRGGSRSRLEHQGPRGLRSLM